MPIPILFTIPNFITAGSGRAMLNIVERLDRTHFSPAVCVSKKGGNLDQAVIELGIPFIEADFTVSPRPYATLLPRARNAACVFRPYRFALWHSFNYSDDYTESMIARLAGAKAWIYTKKNMGWGSRAWKIRSLLANAIPSQNSDMLARFFSSPMYKKKALLLPPGVDTSIFHPNAEPILDIRQKLGIGKDEIVITCVAELVLVKGHSYLLQAIMQIPGIHLLLAGRPSDETHSQRLYQQADDLGISNRTHFLGRVENIPALLAESDIFVLPTISRGEGCAVALLEAMACAKACVATNVPGSRDVIQDGETGLLSPPENAEMLAQALKKLINDEGLRLQLGQAALQQVQKKHIIEQEVQKHEALYQKILHIS